jgi:hypothetical protein
VDADARVRSRPAWFLPAALALSMVVALAPAPAGADHVSGTYDVSVGPTKVGEFTVSGDTVTTFNATFQCPSGPEPASFMNVPINTSSSPHSFASGPVAGMFSPGGAQGQYRSPSPCTVDWTATLRTPPPEPPPTITKSSWKGKENAGFAKFQFTLSSAPTKPFPVDIRTENGSAKAGKDFVALDGTFVVQPGQTQFTVVVILLDDRKDGGAAGEKEKETFRVSSPQDGSTLGLIIDNDQMPGCKCQDVVLLRPKNLKAEAFQFLGFVELRVPIRYRVRCTAGPGGCRATLVHDDNFFQAEFTGGPVQDHQVQPRFLDCGVSCSDQYLEKETMFVYFGKALSTVTSGKLRFRFDVYCGGKVGSIRINAEITFPGGALVGNVKIDYKF